MQFWVPILPCHQNMNVMDRALLCSTCLEFPLETLPGPQCLQYLSGSGRRGRLDQGRVRRRCLFTSFKRIVVVVVVVRFPDSGISLPEIRGDLGGVPLLLLLPLLLPFLSLLGVVVEADGGRCRR